MDGAKAAHAWTRVRLQLARLRWLAETPPTANPWRAATVSHGPLPDSCPANTEITFRGRTMTDPTQREMFEGTDEAGPCTNAAALARIEGLAYVPDFLSPEAQARLLRAIDSMPWWTELRRRVQHYGYRYDYRSRSVDPSLRLGELPAWAVAVADVLRERELVPRPPDQVIVNEYEPGQGISNHIDCEPCFDGHVASVSLGSACVMNFTRCAPGEVVPVLLQPGSVVVLAGEARYAWMHGIPARKSDTFGGRTLARSRRVSLTFRKVILRDERPGG
jgi:alkylated DNA repair dioxygenase AlkB